MYIKLFATSAWCNFPKDILPASSSFPCPGFRKSLQVDFSQSSIGITSGFRSILPVIFSSCQRCQIHRNGQSGLSLPCQKITFQSFTVKDQSTFCCQDPTQEIYICVHFFHHKIRIWYFLSMLCDCGEKHSDGAFRSHKIFIPHSSVAKYSQGAAKGCRFFSSKGFEKFKRSSERNPLQPSGIA